MKTYIERYDIDEELLKRLRTKGLTYREITENMNDEGKEISLSTVRKIIIEMYRKEKQEKSSLSVSKKSSKSKIIEQILSLEKSRKATPMQMRKMAKIYGVEVEFEDELNKEEECK